MTAGPVNAHGWRPLDPDFDRVVLFMANHLMPDGFDVADSAPTTLDELVTHMERSHRMVVWSGASGYTIYGSPQVNYAFRAWHDWCHWQGRFPFTLVGEAQACTLQAAQLMDVFGDTPATRRCRSIIFAEVLGQVAYFDVHGRFPGNQRRFVAQLLTTLHDPGADLPGKAAS